MTFRRLLAVLVVLTRAYRLLIGLGVNRVFGVDTRSGLAALIALLFALWISVRFIGWSLIGLWEERWKVDLLLRLTDRTRGQAQLEVLWDLPAAESYLLLRGGAAKRVDVFKLALLECIVCGFLELQETIVSERPKRIRFELIRGLNDARPPFGSMTAVWNLVPRSSTTPIREVIQTVRKLYGSFNGFVTLEVLPGLLDRGLVVRKEKRIWGHLRFIRLVVTPAGLRARAELEAWMTQTVQWWQRSRPFLGESPLTWMDDATRSVLLASFIGTSALSSALMEPATAVPGTQLERLEQPSIALLAELKWSDGSLDLLFSRLFNSFEARLSAVDSTDEG